MRGYNVLHPMGWDAFGLPAEQYAIETGTHPAITTQKNIANFRRQIQSLGFSYDWEREIDTTDPNYFRWTQWIFIQLYNKGLAYVDEVPVNWCPALGTVLANEEVIDGKSERGNHPVYRRPMTQWMLKITEYAERLLSDLETLDWPAGIKEMQRNWIGKSSGADVDFKVVDSDDIIRVYTTRPDTLFGATYMVLAPEHPLVARLTSASTQTQVSRYQEEAARKSDLDRGELNREKTGVFIGAHALNPVNNEPIPIWISDYVMMGYGTGAIMAVPAHDHRDFEFASKFKIPIRAILAPDPVAAARDNVSVESVLRGEACWAGEGRVINSANNFGLVLNGLTAAEAKTATIAWLTAGGLGAEATKYKLRDWLFSRQRYWGEPFPVVYGDDGTIALLDERELPLTLPEIDDYQAIGTGESPLAKAGNWLNYTDPVTGQIRRRETHTMPQWAGSCWYYLRFIDPHNSSKPWDREKEKYWMPVDLYIGGAEHAVLHLLYARFWHKVLYDLGWVSTNEPFRKLVNQGMILGISYKDESGVLVASDKVIEKDGKHFHGDTGGELSEFPAKMSKSLKNVINPDDIIAEFGADSFRLYEMFMGPLEAVKPWNTNGVEGVRRFLHRCWRMIIDEDGGIAREITHDPLPDNLRRVLHYTIKKVSDDIENLSFNTAISQMMIFVNEFSGARQRNRDAMVTFVKLLSPFAPHLAEELWEKLGHTDTLTYQSWPEYREDFITVDEVEILVQFSGKPKARIMMAVGISIAEMQAMVLAHPEVAIHLGERPIKKVVCVPGRLVNILQ